MIGGGGRLKRNSAKNLQKKSLNFFPLEFYKRNPLKFLPRFCPKCANFFDKINFIIFFHFFTIDVLKRLLGGPETIRVKYQVIFEK